MGRARLALRDRVLQFAIRLDQLGQAKSQVAPAGIGQDPHHGAAERVRLLAQGAPILWADMPTLPLYRQQRTLLMSKKMYAVSSNPTRWGAGWNMDRWALRQE